MTRFAKFAWATLAFNIGVILWGALVRATGSGAGCGSHWPTCNGEVLPSLESMETTIEFVHRATSGVALLLVIGMFIWAWRIYPRGHIVRGATAVSLAFIILEALVGAGLVKFGWVADDASSERAVVISVHLINTFMLVASLALSSWWASGGRRLQLESSKPLLLAFMLALLGVLVIGVTGAITALGDTLFPAESFAAGLQQDLDPNAHFLIRLRVWHPVAAIGVGFYVFFLSLLVAMFRPDRAVRRAAWAVGLLFGLQLAAGLTNLLLNAPLWMQIVHLLLADLVWIALVLLSAAALADQEVEEPARSPIAATVLRPAE